MDILLKSIFGGAMVAAVLLISKFFGSRTAGLVATMPINLTIGYILLVSSGANSKEVLSGFLVGMIPLTIFVLGCFIGIKFTSSILYTLLYGYGGWFLTFFIVKRLF